MEASAADAPGEVEVFEFEHVGAELRNPEVRTPANQTAIVTVWNPYYGIRASRRARLLMSLVLVGPVVVLFGGGLLLVVFQFAPMLGILMMMFAVPAIPIARWIFDDLWLPRR